MASLDGSRGIRTRTMNATYTLEVKDSTLEMMTAFLRGLLEKGVVDALLVPQRTPAGDNVVQTLFTDPARLENIDPIAPVLPVNSTSAVKAWHPAILTRWKNPTKVLSIIHNGVNFTVPAITASFIKTVISNSWAVETSK